MEVTKWLKPSGKRATNWWQRECAGPQGSPLSPLLANLYRRRFVLGWKKLGLENLGMRPSKKSIRRMVEKIHALTRSR